MRIDEIVNSPELLVYHFTSGHNLRAILHENSIKRGTTHVVNRKEVQGVSLTRDRTLDLMKTYAISGHKPFRIGLNFAKLKQRYKVVPARDAMYQTIHKAHQTVNHIISRLNYHPMKTDSNESEEFLVGDIYPLSQYMVEIAVDAAYLDHVNIAIHSGEDPDGNDQMYTDIYAGTFGEMEKYAWRPVRLPSHVKFIEIDHDACPHKNNEIETNYPRSTKPLPNTHDAVDNEWFKNIPSEYEVNGKKIKI